MRHQTPVHHAALASGLMLGLSIGVGTHTAHAQSNDTYNDSRKQQQSDTRQSEATRNNRNMQSDMGDSYLMSADKAVGTTIHNARGEQIAVVTDMILTREDRSIPYVVISTDTGVTDFTGTTHVIPYGSLRWNHAEDRLETTATLNELSMLPEFQYREIELEEGSDFFMDNNQHFTTSEGKAFGKEYANQTPGQFLYLTTLENRTVVDKQGREIGTSGQAFVEGVSGTVALIAVEPEVDAVEGWRLVPMSQLEAIADDTLVASFSLDQFAKAPRWTDDLEAGEMMGQARQAYQAVGAEMPEMKPVDRVTLKSGQAAGNRSME